MQNSQLNKLLHLRQEVKTIPGSDTSKLEYLNNEVHHFINTSLQILVDQGHLTRDELQECLISLKEVDRSRCEQLRTDILFSIELCLHALKRSWPGQNRDPNTP